MLLEVKNCRVEISTMRGTLPAVRGIDLQIDHGEILGLVGESGCGKSTAMHALARINPRSAKATFDYCRLNGVDISKFDDKQMETIRGSEIAYIFQDPQASLNPIMTIGDQLVEALTVKNPGMSREDSERKAVELLDSVKIREPKMRAKSYPHEMSGGMKQRVMIAMALANSPKLLVADEPTTSLDVTIQSEILLLFKEINREKKTSIIFITHDLAVASNLCDRIAVMYAGKMAEIDRTEGILKKPLHPYTIALWNSIPRIDTGNKKLDTIPGTIPNPMDLPGGCAFHPRCPNAGSECRIDHPPLTTSGSKSYYCYHPSSAAK